MLGLEKKKRECQLHFNFQRSKSQAKLRKIKMVCSSDIKYIKLAKDSLKMKFSGKLSQDE